MMNRHTGRILLLTVAFIISFLFCQTAAGEAAGIIDSGTCGEFLSWALDSDGTLTITGTGEMDDYGPLSDSRAPWHPSCSGTIRSVIIGEGVTGVGAYAFDDCSSLTSLSLPGSIARIGAAALADCPDVTVTVAAGSYAHEWCIASGIAFRCAESAMFAGRTTATVAARAESMQCPVCGAELQWAEAIDAEKHTLICIYCGLTDIVTAHNFVPGSGGNLLDPTCTTNGYRYDVCTLCYYEETVMIPAPGHAEVFDAYVHPTCTEPGLTEGSHCSTCGEVLVEQIELPPSGHGLLIAYGTDPDKHTFICTICGEAAGSGIHDFVAGDGGNIIDPGCMTPGYTFRSCSVCYYEDAFEIPPTGHTEVVDPYVYPTCTEPGMTEGVHCATCGEVIYSQIELPPLGHEVRGVQTLDGEYHVFKCATCGGEAEKAVHTFKPVGDGNVVDPTCTKPGYMFKACSVCYYEDAFEVPPTGHTEVIDEYVSPSCTETGLTEGIHCAVCDEILEPQHIIDALGHRISVIQNIHESVVGGEISIDFSILCGHSDGETINWISEDPSIAEFIGVSGGAGSGLATATFSAKSAGVVNVLAEYTDISCTVIVHSDVRAILPEALSTIEAESFMNSDVREVVLPDSLKTIGSRAFAGCSGLIFISMPDSVESIADNAFEGCENVMFICKTENSAAAYAAEHGIPCIILR